MKTYERASWGGGFKCRNCGKEAEWMDGYRKFKSFEGFGRGDDELLDQLCVDCYKNPSVKKR